MAVVSQKQKILKINTDANQYILKNNPSECQRCQFKMVPLSAQGFVTYYWSRVALHQVQYQLYLRAILEDAGIWTCVVWESTFEFLNVFSVALYSYINFTAIVLEAS